MESKINYRSSELIKYIHTTLRGLSENNPLWGYDSKSQITDLNVSVYSITNNESTTWKNFNAIVNSKLYFSITDIIPPESYNNADTLYIESGILYGIKDTNDNTWIIQPSSKYFNNLTYPLKNENDMVEQIHNIIVSIKKVQKEGGSKRLTSKELIDQYLKAL